MSKNKKNSKDLIFSLVLSGLCVALSIVLSKFLSFSTPIVRIGFGELPVILAAIFINPFVGAAVGICADLLGCLFAGYAPIPLITVGVAVTGLLSGVLYKYVFRKLPLTPKLILSIMLGAFVGSSLISSFGLWLAYAQSTPYLVYYFSNRLLPFLVNYSLTVVIIRLVMINNSISRFLQSRNIG